MRTTVTFDPDVAARLQKLQRTRQIPFKQAVNDALREWLNRAEEGEKACKPFRQRSYDTGRLLVPPEQIKEALLAIDDERDAAKLGIF